MENVFQQELQDLEAQTAKNQSLIKKLEGVAIALFVLGFLVFVFGLVKLSELKLNELGDFYAGTVGVLWTLASITLIYVSFLGQKIQLLTQSNELKLQSHEIKQNKQNFDKQIENNDLRIKMEIHARFQSEMREIQRGFTNNVNSEAWIPDEDELRNISIYWYFVFDEWFTCINGGDSLKTLWTNHYRIGAKSALKKPKFKERVDELLASPNSFLGMGKEFKIELSSIVHEIIEEQQNR
jgi:hypothetical protein